MAIIEPALTVASSTDTHELLVRLLGCEAATSDGMLSLYVDLDPRDGASAADRARGLAAIFDEAERRAPDAGWHRLLGGVQVELEASTFDTDGVRALAAFVDLESGLREAVLLPRATGRLVTFGRSPYLRPLIETLPSGHWCTVLVSRRVVRMFCGTRECMEEVHSWGYDVPSQHHAGGLSQANYERSIEQNVDEHLRNVAADLPDILARYGAHGVVMGGPTEVRRRLERLLGQDVRRKLVAQLDIDVERATLRAVCDATTIAIDAHDERCQSRLLERLHADDARGVTAAWGIDAVLDALSQGRVETLAIAEGFRAAGATCTQCGWASGPGGAPGGTCPLDGSTLEHRDDVVEDAVESAVRRNAHVVNVGRDATFVHAPILPSGNGDGSVREPRRSFLDLQALGGIAATLRF